MNNKQHVKLIISSERETQNKLIETIIKRDIGIRYIGKLDNDYHSNVLEDKLSEYLTCNCGHSITDAKAAIRQLHNVITKCTSFNNLCEVSKEVYSLLRYGVQIEQINRPNKTIHFIDWKKPQNNIFELADEVQVKTTGSEHDSRRPDIVLYVNGIALVVLELKKATVPVAESIRQNWRNQQDANIPRFFTTVQLTLAGNTSEGLFYGTTCTSEKYYLKWKEPVGRLGDNSQIKATFSDEQNLMIRSALQLLEPNRLLEFIHDMVVYDGGIKKVARPNQYFALRAAQPRIRNKKSGIIWHSQGSGKSLTMVWLANWIFENIENSRVVIITDRDELDTQITSGLRASGVFAKNHEDSFYHAKSGNDLLNKLNNVEPRLITTLVHKFAARGGRNTTDDYKKGNHTPEQWLREIGENLETIFPGFEPKGNIFVFVDECHRTQGGVMHQAMKKIMGKEAMLIGFTGTPLLKKEDKNSILKFGNYIHCYRFDEAVEDKVVLDLRYEARDVDQHLNNANALDTLFENTTKRLSSMAKEEIQKRWSELQKLYSSKERMERIVANILYDMEMKPALKAGYGNAMLVCDSIYQAYQYWHIFKENGFKDYCAVVSSYEPTELSLSEAYTGAKRTEEEQKYQYAKEMMGDKKPEDFEKWAKEQFIEQPAKMKLLIVCDKLLTGFDAPSATYLYLDKKIVDHTLFQAICRVNRVNGENKLFGYIVDYRKLFNFIKGAIVAYTTAQTNVLQEFDNDWDIGELNRLLKERLQGLKKSLEDAFEEIALLTEDVKHPKSEDDYYDYYCYPSNVTDFDKQGEFLEKNLQKRQVFYNSIKKLERIYADLATEIDKVYSNSEAQEKYIKIRDYEALRIALMRRSGDIVDFKVYDAEMRSLIDRYVSADATEMIDDLTEISFLDVITKEIDDIESKSNSEKTNRGRAEAMINNTRQYVNRSKNKNHSLYTRLSTRLQKLLDELHTEKIEYGDFLKEIKRINEELVNGGGKIPKSIDTKAKRALYDNLGENEELALKIYAFISKNVQQGFRSNQIFKQLLYKKLEKELKDTDFSVNDIMKIVIDCEEWI